MEDGGLAVGCDPERSDAHLPVPSLSVNELVTLRAAMSTSDRCSNVGSTKWKRVRSGETTSERASRWGSAISSTTLADASSITKMRPGSAPR